MISTTPYIVPVKDISHLPQSNDIMKDTVKMSTMPLLNQKKISSMRKLLYILLLVVLPGIVTEVMAQATIQANGTTTICAGESTTIDVLICGGDAPWTVV